MLSKIHKAVCFIVDRLPYIVFWASFPCAFLYWGAMLRVVGSVKFPDIIGFALGIATLVSSSILLVACGFLNETYLGRMVEHRIFVAIGFFAASYATLQGILQSLAPLLTHYSSP